MVKLYISRSCLSLLDSSRSVSGFVEVLVVGDRISQSLSCLAILVIIYFQRWKFNASLTSSKIVLSFDMVKGDSRTSKQKTMLLQKLDEQHSLVKENVPEAKARALPMSQLRVG